MLQLRRIRLDSVGHPNARFAPLELRLTDDEARPTHTVLWLRNGGGKSSLLNLLFAVVRPNRREFLGSNEDGKNRRLADYVLADDTSHVCIEWGEPGVRTPALVTGMCLEWRDRVRSSDESRLRRLWYAFVPSDHRPPGLLEFAPTLTFDTLPIAEDGRRLSLARFRERVRTVAVQDPSLRLVTPTSQAEWRRELEQHDLDPEVLRYQLQMNREEGGASELFKRRCRTESDFVDLLLELAVADEQSDRVADVYLRYADELARRPDVERNRAFLAGALDRLQPVIEAERRRDAAESTLHDVLGNVAATIRGLRQAAADAQARAGDHEAQARDADEAAGAHDARARHLRTQAAAARRRAAELDVDAAQEHLAAASAALEQADARLAAVALLEPMARSMQLAAEITTIDRRLEADQPEIADELARARRRLSQRLRTEERAHRASADEHDRLAAEAADSADEAEQQAQRLVAERGRVEQARATLAERRDDWQRRMRELTARGALAPDEEPQAAHDRLSQELRGAQREQAQRDRQLTQLDTDLREGYARLAAIDGAHSDARARLSDRVHARDQLDERVRALTAEERLHELAETADIDLWDAAGLLLDRLDHVVDDADRRLADDAVAAAADRAAVAALQADGLLPARRDVQQVVEVLERDGIGATSGWRFLAERVAVKHREALIAQIPGIVDGVVIGDARQLEPARQAVARMADPLSTVVVVAAAPRVDEEAQATTTIVAPVDAALYDHGRAEDARERLRSRLEHADRRRASLVSGRARDAALADRLRRLLASYPVERRRAIADEVEQAAAACERLRAEREALHERLERMHEQRGTLADAQTGVPRDIGALTSLLNAVEALASEPDADDTELVERARTVDQQANDQMARAQRLRREAGEHAMTAQRHREQADRLRDQRAELQVTDVPDEDDAGDEPLEVLEQRVRTLTVEVDAALAGSTLGERRRLLIERRAELDQELARADERIRATATDLLRAPEGRTRESRTAALRDAERQRDAALGARAETAERVRSACAARDRLPAAALEGDGPEPQTTAQAEQLEQRLLADAEDSVQTATAARAAAEHARQRAREHARDTDEFEHLAELLAVEVRGHPAADAGDAATPEVSADPEEARSTVDELRSRLTGQSSEADRAARALSQCAADVRRFVTDAQFTALDGPIRARLAGDPVAVVRDDPAMVEQLSVRLSQCEQKLEELTRHRRLLVREIAADVQRGLWLLRQADHVSSLPPGFGDWSDQRFLHIRFATPAVDNELVERLEAMVDDLVDEGVRPSGVPLLQRATHAAVGPTGFGVRILKPNPALRPERVPVTELATFSGGEQLTAAILLYCTLARLRAQARQTQSTAGVLTLDNPIGKSSNVTLLQLQRRVADAMGVQLVYTTAVDDREAVGVLPHWIRLRNDRRDTRTGNQHVEMAQSDADIPHSMIAATHMWRRSDATRVP